MFPKASPSGTFYVIRFKTSKSAVAEATKRFASVPIVIKHMVKKFSGSRAVRKRRKNTRFYLENTKNKAENEAFRTLQNGFS